MNAPIFQPLAAGRRRDRRGAFALVITLLILSLLVVVAVSYLSSMVSERQTADAYSSKARAEQVAQAGVDSAMAIMAQSFRDFPDSATAWDTQQTGNLQSSTSGVVSTAYNQGTSLYLRAVADQTTGAANPKPAGTNANDPKGNDPDNPACKNFVLPLISGVPNGRAQPVSGKTSIFPQKMDLSVTDPVAQNYTDLNVRRFKGDLQGVIGSPPKWAPPAPYPTPDPTDPTMPPAYPPAGPRPARAYWVNMKDNAGRTTGRYAFWIDDESFRTNINAVGGTDPTALRPDNSQDGVSLPRSVQPKDMMLGGTIADFDSASGADAAKLLTTRTQFPGTFFPDPLAFSHTFDTLPKPLPTPTTQLVDGTRYLTTTQSGALNLTRHGTQRLNLNSPTTIAADKPVTMPEIRKLVETLRFHLPNWGQRFYRLTNPDPYPVPGSFTPTARGTGLNKTDDVSAAHTEVYFYKTAANLRDYIDTDNQPTMIVRPQNGAPTLAPNAPPIHPFGGDGEGGDGDNYMWAQGKEAAPFLQEALVRYRPSIQIVGTGPTSQANYTLTVDYYVEFWNMTDHDIKASDLGAHPFVRISNQQPWVGGTIDRIPGTIKPTSTATVPSPGAALGNYSGDNTVPAGVTGPARDFNLNIGGTVYCASAPTIPLPGGVVFKAGAATVITTDPDSLLPISNPSSILNSKYVYSGKPVAPTPYSATTSGFYAPNVYYVPVDLTAQPGGKRTFAGPTNIPESSSYLRGVTPDFRGPKSVVGLVYLDYEVEVTLGNDNGYIDCATGAFAISAGSGDGGAGSTNGYDFTWTDASNTAQRETHNDYLHGGSLGGNSTTPSQLGDPRTNNEQLYMKQFAGVSFPAQPDQARYAAAGVGDAPPFTLGLPNNKYVKPTTLPNVWADYFDWNNTSYPTSTLTAATAPSVVANSALTSIGQLGDLFDPARVLGTVGTNPTPNIIYSRGGGRTMKIGQRDDRFWYDPATNAANNSTDNIAASNGWASWRLADVFSIDDTLELPARININGVTRDGGAALRAALTGFKFQPQTQVDSGGNIKDSNIHGTANLSGATLKTLPTDTTGVSKLTSYIKTRLAANAASANIPFGPFFERGELGELEIPTNNGVALFGKNVTSTFVVSTDLAGTGMDLNHTFDRGREELFRRLVELTCTRGDTFTVYAVGQSMVQTDTSKPAKITGTHRMRVTFRLVPKRYTDVAQTTLADFHPGYTLSTDGSKVVPADFNPDDTAIDPTDSQSLYTRFAKPDLYDVQILEVNTL